MFFTLILSSFLTFVELNCENLFDTRHDSLKNDYEFLPQSSYQVDALSLLAQTGKSFQDYSSFGL